MPSEKAPVKVSFWSSPRKVIHTVTFVFIFCATVAELGLVSHQLHKYGDGYENYPTQEYKHAIGLLLFACVGTLLYLIGAPKTNIVMAAFGAFVMAVFWGAGAGMIFQLTPFKGTRCDHDPASWPAVWQPYAYAGECAKIVAIEALAWTLWGSLVLFLFALLYQAFDLKRTRRQTVFGV